MSTANSAILALLFWGVSDCLLFAASRESTLEYGLARVQLWGLLAFLPFFREINTILHISQSTIALVAIGALFYVVGWIAYAQAMKMGQLALVSPMGGLFGLVQAAIGIVLFGESATWPRLVALFLAIVGVALTLMPFTPTNPLQTTRPTKSIVFRALFAALAWGILPVFWRPCVREIGPVSTVLITKLVALPIFGIIALRRPQKHLGARVRAYLLIAGVTDVAALATYNTAMSQDTSMAAPIVASYPAISVMVGGLVFAERLMGRQWVGLVLVVLAIFAASMG
jgi:uncharacterized membrane protein